MIRLSRFGIRRPEKIRWMFSPESEKSILEAIPSKSLRKFLAHSPEILVEKGIESETVLVDETTYREWHTFYTKVMSAQNHEVLAPDDYLHQKKLAGEKVWGIFYRKNSKLLAGEIITEKKDFTSLAFKASERIDISNESGSNLGSMLEYASLCLAESFGKPVSSGVSRNAFGFYNTMGYLEFKLRFGYQATLESDVNLLDEVPLQSGKATFFFGVDSNEHSNQALTPYFLTTTPSDTSKIQEIQKRLPEIQVLTLD